MSDLSLNDLNTSFILSLLSGVSVSQTRPPNGFNAARLLLFVVVCLFVLLRRSHRHVVLLGLCVQMCERLTSHSIKYGNRCTNWAHWGLHPSNVENNASCPFVLRKMQRFLPECANTGGSRSKQVHLAPTVLLTEYVWISTALLTEALGCPPTVYQQCFHFFFQYCCRPHGGSIDFFLKGRITSGYVCVLLPWQPRQFLSSWSNSLNNCHVIG